MSKLSDRKGIGRLTDDLAGIEYWNSLWQGAARQRPVVPHAPGVRNHLRREFHAFFTKNLGDGQGRKLLEVGCANSIWLPYFCKELGFSAAGLDYSETGCVQARSILAASGLASPVFLGDFFSPPSELCGQFDVVFSYGLVEHFDPTEDALIALSHLLKPGGKMITIVPNLSGWLGTLQRLLNRPVFDIHVPMDLDDFEAAHKKSGLVICRSGYLCSINFGVINLDGTTGGLLMRTLKRLFVNAMIGFSALVWWLEDHHMLRVRPHRLISPYIACVATKGESSAS